MEWIAVVIGVGLAFVAGGWTTYGVVSAASGKVFYNPRRIKWTRGEAEIIGLAFAGQGFLLGCWALYTAASLAARVRPGIGIGEAWYVVEPLMMFLVIPLVPVSMGLVEQHHFGRWPFRESRGRASTESSGTSHLPL